MPTLLPPKLVATSPVSCDQGKDGCARSAGLLWSPPEVETDVLKLWVAQDTRLQHELGFYEEHFSRPRAASILFTPQPGKSLLTVEAFDEVRTTAAFAIPATHAPAWSLKNAC